MACCTVLISRLVLSGSMSQDGDEDMPPVDAPVPSKRVLPSRRGRKRKDYAEAYESDRDDEEGTLYSHSSTPKPTIHFQQPPSLMQPGTPTRRAKAVETLVKRRRKATTIQRLNGREAPLGKEGRSDPLQRAAGVAEGSKPVRRRSPQQQQQPSPKRRQQQLLRQQGRTQEKIPGMT